MLSGENAKILDVADFPLGSLVHFHYEDFYEDRKYFVLFPKQKYDPISCEPLAEQYENHVQFLKNEQEFNDYVRYIVMPSYQEEKYKWRIENQKLFLVTLPMLLIDGKKVSYQKNDLEPKDIWEEVTLLLPDLTTVSVVASRSQWTFKHLDIKFY